MTRAFFAHALFEARIGEVEPRLEKPSPDSAPTYEKLLRVLKSSPDEIRLQSG
jgi:hypothetical protein